MKKILSSLIILALVLSFAACGKAPKETVIDLTAVKEKITEGVELQEPMPLEVDALSDLYGIDSEDVTECEALVTMDGTFPDEIIMVKAANEEAKAKIVESFNSRLSEVKIQSQNYDETNYKLAQECKVLTEGSYVALFISANHAKMETIFESAVEQK